MKRLIGFALLVAVAWYGWKNFGNLRAAPANEVVIENGTGRTVARVRLSIGEKEYPAYDSLYDGKSVTQPFPLSTSDGAFHLHWVVPGKAVEPEWSGGVITAGPVRMRHHLLLVSGDGVVWSSAPIPTDAK